MGLCGQHRARRLLVGTDGQDRRTDRAVPLGLSRSQLTAHGYQRVQGFTHLLLANAEPCQPVLEGSQEAALTPAAAAAASPIGEEQPWEQLQGSSRGFI